MTTQFTPILQLALPVTGELNGTWGDVVNDNITSMIEEAIAGLATIDTWTANSHTLTTADGTTDEARCAILKVANGAGGTALSGAGEIICPARTKVYVVDNTSSYTVTLKTAAGTGIAVPSGKAALLYCDGTNVKEGAEQGDVVGPSSATDGGVALYDGTTGKLIKNSANFTQTSGGNVLLGTTTDFTSTSSSGAEVVSGYGVYPFLTQTGTTNTTAIGSIVASNSTVFAGDNGATSKTLSGVQSVPSASNTGIGGSSTVGVTGVYSWPTIQSSGASARISMNGIYSIAYRANSNDLSSHASNSVWSGAFYAHHETTLPSTASSNQLFSLYASTNNRSGTVGTACGLYMSTTVGASSISASSTGLYNIYVNDLQVGSSSGAAVSATTVAAFYSKNPRILATGTVTNLYGIYLGAATVSGTLTNKYGIYSADTTALNYLGGNTGIGVIPATSKGVLQVGTLNYTGENILGAFASSVNTYNQVISQNTNTGSAASSDFVVSVDNSTDTTYYGDFGMNGSGWTGTGPFDSPDRVYLTSTTSDLAIGTTGTNKIIIATNSLERGQVTSAGNVLLGTTTDFTSTSAAGAVATSGYAMYPFGQLNPNTGAITTPQTAAISSSFAGSLTPVSGDGSATKTFTGYVSQVNVSATSGGGTFFTSAYGVYSSPRIVSSDSSAASFTSAYIGQAMRYSTTDTSTYANNNIEVLSGGYGHSASLPATAVTGNSYGTNLTFRNNSGVATNVYGHKVTMAHGSNTGAQISSSTGSYGYHSSYIVGSGSSGASTVTTQADFYSAGLVVNTTGTVTNHYGLYLGAKSGAGTLTNNWGVYQADTAATNYIAGKTGFGTTTPKSTVDIVGLPVYANNAAAIAGGLVAGSLYRTGADPDPVCVVH